MLAKTAQFIINKPLFLLISLVLVFGSGALVAQPGQSACQKDAGLFCSGVQPGDGRVRKCLKENESSLSQACRDHLASWAEARAGIRRACQVDYRKHCKGKKGKAALECLRSRSDLTPACQEVLQNPPAN